MLGKRILICKAQVPFVRGGADALALALRDRLQEAGHRAEIVGIPFKSHPPEQILKTITACRLLDVSDFGGHGVDRVIGLDFPAYLIPHPDKVLWLVSQHRPAYDLWEQGRGDLVTWPDGREVRGAVHDADRRFIPEARAIYTVSPSVGRRLREGSAIASAPLYPPPADDTGGGGHDGPPGDYLFYPARLAEPERQALVLEALARVRHPVEVRFAGAPDDEIEFERMRAYAAVLKVAGRVAWLGPIDEASKHAQYAGALAVLSPVADDDGGEVVLEAMRARRPSIACTDSGGALDLLRPGETGLVAEPDAASLARAMDELWEDRSRSLRMGESARDLYASLRISWERVLERLLA